MAAELAFTVVRAAATTGTAVVAIAGGAWWTCGARGRLAVSHDQGATWTSLDTGTDVDLNGVARTRDGAVWAVGGNGFAARIVGDRLERIALGTAADLTGVHALDDEVVVLANDGAIRRWRDGRIAVVHTGVTARLTGLAVLRHGTWVVVGAGGLVLRSPDGAWFARGQPGVDHDLEAVAVTTDHRVIAVGARGCVLVSHDDGRTWHAMTAPDARQLRCVATSGSSALIGGEGGLLVRLAPPDQVPEPEPIGGAPPAPAPKPAPAAPPQIDPAPKPAPAAPPRIDPARVNAGLALSRRALAMAPDDAEIQLAHAMLLVDVARAGMRTALDELRAQLPSFAPAIRARIEQAVDDPW